MAAKRPTVVEYSALTGEKTAKTYAMPHVFQTPLRSDVVHQVHSLMNKNHRQAHGVAERAGHMTSAESWGTGRAVARIPRVAGGGTHRSGQGAFGNMCRGGHMFSPKVVWRRWSRRISFNMRRFATSCAVAASAVPALVMARGHRIQNVPQVPLVIATETLAKIKKTKDAAAMLKKIGVWADIERVIASHKIRAGMGKLRNRRYVQRRGPLVVYKTRSNFVRALRNIPGVDVCRVNALNLLQLAPGAHLGRLVIWASDAFAELDNIFGSFSTTECAKGKTGFHLPRAKMTNTNLDKIMHSAEIAKFLRPTKKVARTIAKKNPLRNFSVMMKLNPHAEKIRRDSIVAQLKKAGKLAAEPAAKKAKKAPKKDASKPKKTAEQKAAAIKKTNAAKKAARKAFVKALFA